MSDSIRNVTTSSPTIPENSNEINFDIEKRSGDALNLKTNLVK